MNKKIVYLSLFLVLAMFLISACQEIVGGKMDSKGGSRPKPPKITNLEIWSGGYKGYYLLDMMPRFYFYANTRMNADSAGIVSQSISCNIEENGNLMPYLYSWTRAGLVKDKYDGKFGIDLSGWSNIDFSGKKINCNSKSYLMDLYEKYSDDKWQEMIYNPSAYSYPSINDVKLVKLNDGKYYVYLNADNNNGGICDIHFSMSNQRINSQGYDWSKTFENCETTTLENPFFEIPAGLSITSGETYNLNLDLYGKDNLYTYGYGSYTWNPGSTPLAIGKVQGVEFKKTTMTKEAILKSQEFIRKTLKK